MHASGHSLQQTTCMSLHQNNTTCTILVMTSSHFLTLMTCSLGSRLQSAKVRRSPSRNFLLETVTSSLELWSISSGRGLTRYLSRRWNSLSRFFSWSDGSEPQRRDVFPLVYYNYSWSVRTFTQVLSFDAILRFLCFILCNFIHFLHYISEGNAVYFTPLQL